MTDEKIFNVSVNCPNSALAKKIAKELIKQKLAACANIVDGVSSIYFWNNELVEDSEQILHLKTTKRALTEVFAQVNKLHSDEVAAINASEIQYTEQSYKNWVFEQVKLVEK